MKIFVIPIIAHFGYLRRISIINKNFYELIPPDEIKNAKKLAHGNKKGWQKR
jgi:hypothetical protein